MTDDARERLTLLENLSKDYRRGKDQLDYYETVLLWQKCRDAAERGETIPLTHAQKKALYVVHSSLTIVYFVFAPAAQLVKIGKTNNLAQRMSTLQNGSPVELQLLTTIEYDDDLERRLHDYFSELRCHGEWFRADKTLKDFLRGYRDSGLRWVIDQVGDRYEYWMNRRPRLAQDMRDAQLDDVPQDGPPPLKEGY